MCFWHFLSNILQEHTQPLLTGLASSFQDTDPAAHSEITQPFVFSNVYPGLFYKFTRQAFRRLNMWQNWSLLKSLCAVRSGGVRETHSFEVYWGQQRSVITVSACTVLFPDIRGQTGSLTLGWHHSSGVEKGSEQSLNRTTPPPERHNRIFLSLWLIISGDVIGKRLSSLILDCLQNE